MSVEVTETLDKDSLFLADFYQGSNLPDGFDKKLVKAAFNFAEKAHAGQKRKSGEDYIIHPVEVAKILLSLSMPADMIAAALLHDTIEDTKTTKADIEAVFGHDIVEMVLAVTKLGIVDFSAYSKEEVKEAKANLKNESLRQLFLAMAEDARVVIIKLADRLHNIRTIKYLPKNDRVRIARETLNIFAPLALRIGMGEIKGELEDRAFPVAYPEEYKKVKNEANRRVKAADRYVLHLKRILSDDLIREKIPAEIQGRAKHLYSLFRKLTRPEINWDFEKIYDLVALRIITDRVENCYLILGHIHRLYRPLPNYIRDYIAAPKPNGYRSIHTSVFGPDGKIVEIQIRTQTMHEEAEFGIASHLHYSMEKASGASDDKLSRGTFAKADQTEFLRQIKNWQDSIKNSADFVEGLRMEFLDDRIYVFSPKGDIYDLVTGATPVDFAFEVHSKIGDSCIGAKVNGRIVPLDHKLETRNVVEIITSKNAIPRRDWLDFVKTSKAKQHIRSFFRKFEFEKNCEEGKIIVASELGILGIDITDYSEAEIKDTLSDSSFKTLTDLYASVGAGLTTPRQAVKIILGRQFIPEKKEDSGEKKKIVSTTEAGDLSVRIAPCCNPEQSDSVICYITRGKGFTVHKKGCKNLGSLEQERLFAYNPWKQEGIKIKTEVVGLNRVGMIRDIASAISDSKINIESMKSRHKKELSYFDIIVSVNDISEAADLLKRLKKVKDVVEVRRII